MQPEPGAPAAESTQEVRPYAWYMLAVLVLVYIFNFVDRQLLTILAPELKRDLGISDADFGFLYGTAFGVFYALFGIPLGKLADRWLRIRLLALGLVLWSAMTALSGFSRNLGQLGAARMGVGIGEATLSPCTYSLVSDYFPPHRRATALGIYSTGLYLGTGISLFLGSSIVEIWNAAYPEGGAPLGLAGWQMAFLCVGIPGLLLSLWLASLREPVRGAFDGIMAGQMMTTDHKSTWAGFFQDLADIVPPFTLVGAARRGLSSLFANLVVAAIIAAATCALIALSGDRAQWIAFGIGCYAILSWVAALRHREPDAFDALFRSKPFLGVTLGYAFLSFLGYANFGFAPLYAIQELGADPRDAGFMLGSLGALAGSVGVVGGGMIADYMARDGIQARRVLFTGIAAAGTMLCHGVMFTAGSLPFYYAAGFVTLIFMSAALGGASGTVVNIVPPQLRGMATAAFLLGTNMIGLALGPYTGGKLSILFDDLGMGMLALTAILPVTLAALAMAYIALPKRA